MVTVWFTYLFVALTLAVSLPYVNMSVKYLNKPVTYLTSTLLAVKLTFIFMLLIKPFNCSKVLERHERALVFPNNTVLQITIGVATPALIPNRNMFLNACFQANYAMPYNASGPEGMFFGTPIISGREFKDRYKRDVTSNILYENIAEGLNEYGMDGEQCLLKSICQLAQSPLHRESDDIVGDLLHFLLTPSEHSTSLSKDSTIPTIEDDEHAPAVHYLKAERHGAAGKNCTTIYSRCPESILDQITEEEFY